MGMGKALTVTLPDDRYERIEDMVESGDVSSKSEAVNQLISRGEETNTLEARNKELRNQLKATNSANDKLDKLREDSNAPFFIKWYRWYKNR